MRHATLTIWLLAVLFLIWHSSGALRASADERWSVLTTPPLTELDTRMLNMVTLGHRGLYDDFINIWAIQFLFDERLKQEDPEDIQKSLLAITRHKPKLESLYMAGCYTLYWEFDRPDLCEKITLDGLAAFPNSWRIPLSQGFVSAHALKDWDQAAIFYGMAASRENSPAWLNEVAKNIVRDNKLTLKELTDSLKALGAEENSKFGSFLEELDKRRNQR